MPIVLTEKDRCQKRSDYLSTLTLRPRAEREHEVGEVLRGTWGERVTSQWSAVGGTMLVQLSIHARVLSIRSRLGVLIGQNDGEN